MISHHNTKYNVLLHHDICKVKEKMSTHKRQVKQNSITRHHDDLCLSVAS